MSTFYHFLMTLYMQLTLGDACNVFGGDLAPGSTSLEIEINNRNSCHFDPTDRYHVFLLDEKKNAMDIVHIVFLIK